MRRRVNTDPHPWVTSRRGRDEEDIEDEEPRQKLPAAALDNVGGRFLAEDRRLANVRRAR